MDDQNIKWTYSETVETFGFEKNRFGTRMTREYVATTIGDHEGTSITSPLRQMIKLGPYRVTACYYDTHTPIEHYSFEVSRDNTLNRMELCNLALIDEMRKLGYDVRSATKLTLYREDVCKHA